MDAAPPRTLPNAVLSAGPEVAPLPCPAAGPRTQPGHGSRRRHRYCWLPEMTRCVPFKGSGALPCPTPGACLQGGAAAAARPPTPNLSVYFWGNWVFCFPSFEVGFGHLYFPTKSPSSSKVENHSP